MIISNIFFKKFQHIFLLFRLIYQVNINKFTNRCSLPFLLILDSHLSTFRDHSWLSRAYVAVRNRSRLSRSVVRRLNASKSLLLKLACLKQKRWKKYFQFGCILVSHVWFVLKGSPIYKYKYILVNKYIFFFYFIW